MDLIFGRAFFNSAVLNDTILSDSDSLPGQPIQVSPSHPLLGSVNRRPGLNTWNRFIDRVIRVEPDRIAFCVNNECALYCRYCLRKRMVGDAEWTMQKKELEVALDWIAATPEIRDVLLTGGDPLIFSDARLEWLLTRLREIPHVELIRLGTRLPVTLPFRGTDDLSFLSGRRHPVQGELRGSEVQSAIAQSRNSAAVARGRRRVGTPCGHSD